MSQVDIRTKEYVRRHAVFADIFNYYIYAGKDVIQPERLKEMDTTELALPKADGRSTPVQKYRDVLKNAVIMGDGTLTYRLILGVENQKYVHYGMPVKTMVYDALNYASQIQGIAKENRRSRNIKGSAEYLSGLRKEDRLTPVITLVLYFGQEPWDGAEELHGLLEPTSEVVLKYIPNYKINLISPVMMSDHELALFKSDFRELATFIRYGKDKEKMKKLMEENEAYQHMDPLTAEIVNDVTNAKLKLETNEDGEVDMCEAILGIREEGVQEGIQTGIRRGIQQGITDTFHALILELLQKNYDVPSELEKKIQENTDQKELKLLFDYVTQAKSLEEFEGMSEEILK